MRVKTFMVSHLFKSVNRLCLNTDYNSTPAALVRCCSHVRSHEERGNYHKIPLKLFSPPLGLICSEWDTSQIWDVKPCRNREDKYFSSRQRQRHSRKSALMDRVVLACQWYVTEAISSLRPRHGVSSEGWRWVPIRRLSELLSFQTDSSEPVNL